VLISQDAINQPILSQRWLSLPDNVSIPIKQSILSTLGSPQNRVGNVAAQCVSSVAAVELPEGKWPELIPALLEFVGNQENQNLRVYTLVAIGFICEVTVSAAGCLGNMPQS
jgi:importin subunit beta-1